MNFFLHLSRKIFLIQIFALSIELLMLTKRNLDTVKSETPQAVEIWKRLESFDGGLNGVNRQMAKILTANRQ